MKWFQHDSNAGQDAKIKKLIIKHGAVGYAIYFHCLELIANDITVSNISFELEHDSEIIADNLKIESSQNESAIDLVNRVMKTIISLGLFECHNNKIFCLKLAQRLDNTVSRSPEINKIKDKTTKLLQSNNVVTAKELGADKIKIDKNKSNQRKSDKIEYRENVLLTEKEYNTLIEKYGKENTEKLLDKLHFSKLAKGYKYESDYGAINQWVVDALKLKDKNVTQNKKDYSGSW